MRVVSGSAGGIPLACPRTPEVRPTMDRVRAAIFSSLGERVPGARVLDLFAGSGALGIEALSRGAERAVFVEKDRGAVDFIRRNLTKTRVGERSRVICGDVFKFLERHKAPEDRFDLVFADPPYTSDAQPINFAGDLLERLSEPLAPEGWLVLEKSPLHALPIPAAWEVLRQKRYGTTEVLFLARSAAGA